MNFQKVLSNKKLYFILSYFLLWIILFGFLIPANNFLPKPSIVLMSLSALWEDYHLAVNLISTFSTIYISVIIAYFLVYAIIKFIINENSFLFDFISSLSFFPKYIPDMVFGFFLIFWLPNSPITGFIFITVIVFYSLIVKVHLESKKVKHEYIDTARALGSNKSIIARKVVWKAIGPSLIKYLLDSHTYLWSILIAFEFIKGGRGLGTIFKTALMYRDLSAMFTVTLIIGIVIYFTGFLLKYLKNKFFHWSNC